MQQPESVQLAGFTLNVAVLEQHERPVAGWVGHAEAEASVGAELEFVVGCRFASEHYAGDEVEAFAVDGDVLAWQQHARGDADGGGDRVGNWWCAALGALAGAEREREEDRYGEGAEDAVGHESIVAPAVRALWG